ncbi:MAG TPA: hypothetical protein VGR16_07605 [Thermomicrobiales bacterium]|nr:hypothetical protein [Thermomicrobiales bacterium]
MQYDVTYQVGGDQHVVRVDAADAASAAQTVQEEHGHGADLFELISVQLLDELPPEHHSTFPGSDHASSA